jgi:hypothetical protein
VETTTYGAHQVCGRSIHKGENGTINNTNNTYINYTCMYVHHINKRIDVLQSCHRTDRLNEYATNDNNGDNDTVKVLNDILPYGTNMWGLKGEPT